MQRCHDEIPCVYEAEEGNERSRVQEFGKIISDLSDGQVWPRASLRASKYMANIERRNLMAKDEFKNLGFAEEDESPTKDRKDGGKKENTEILW